LVFGGSQWETEEWVAADKTAKECEERENEEVQERESWMLFPSSETVTCVRVMKDMRLSVDLSALLAGGAGVDLQTYLYLI